MTSGLAIDHPGLASIANMLYSYSEIAMRGGSRTHMTTSDLSRVIAVASCGVLAALAPFYAGISLAFLGLIPLGLAVWLVMRSGWSSRTRVTTSLALLGGTIALFIGLLAVVLRYYNN